MSQLNDGRNVCGSHNTQRGAAIPEPPPHEKAPIFQKKCNEGELMEWGSSTSVEKHNRHKRNLLKFWGLHSLMRNNNHMNNGSTNVSKSKSHLKIPGARRVTSVYGRPGARHVNSSILRQKKLKSQILPLKNTLSYKKKITSWLQKKQRKKCRSLSTATPHVIMY